MSHGNPSRRVRTVVNGTVDRNECEGGGGKREGAATESLESPAIYIFRKFPPISGETLRLSSYYVVEVFGSAESNILLPKLTLTQQTLRLTLPSARKGGPAKWSGLDAFAFAVKVKQVAEIQSDFVAGAKS